MPAVGVAPRRPPNSPSPSLTAFDATLARRAAATLLLQGQQGFFLGRRKINAERLVSQGAGLVCASLQGEYTWFPCPGAALVPTSS